MGKLNDIMTHYGTDKMAADCNYVPLYEKILDGKENEKLKILEIGIFRQPPSVEGRPVDKGRRLTAASIRTWYDYLPNSEIYAIDLYDFKDFNNDRIHTFICNQESVDDLEDLITKIGGDFDMIIDDGGHMMNQHQISLSTLFKYVKQGGVYVIEDLLTCHMPNYVRGDKTTLDVLYEYQKTKKINSTYINDENVKYIEDNILVVEVHATIISEIALIFKK